MSNFTEICIAAFCILQLVYLFFAVYRDIRQLQFNKEYREEWLASSKNIMRLVVDMDRMQHYMAYLQEKEKGAEREG